MIQIPRRARGAIMAAAVKHFALMSHLDNTDVTLAVVVAAVYATQAVASSGLNNALAIASATGLPRSTVVRKLNTAVHEGMVEWKTVGRRKVPVVPKGAEESMRFQRFFAESYFLYLDTVAKMLDTPPVV